MTVKQCSSVMNKVSSTVLSQVLFVHVSLLAEFLLRCERRGLLTARRKEGDVVSKTGRRMHEKRLTEDAQQVNNFRHNKHVLQNFVAPSHY
jgi:hypothetical protein